MSYIHPEYDNWYNALGGPAVMEAVGWWRAYHPAYDHMYYAVEFEDGWFTVDGDEWFGEFPSKAEAEAYLGLVFQVDAEYHGEYDSES